MKNVFILFSVAAASLLVMSIGYANVFWFKPLPTHACCPYGSIDISVTSCSDGARWDPCRRIIMVQADGLYPGKTKAYTITLRNSGNQPAKLSGVIISGFHNTSALQLAMIGQQNIISLNKPEYSSICLDAAAIRQANGGRDIIIQPGQKHDYTLFFSVGIPVNAGGQTSHGGFYGFEIDTDFTVN